MTTVFALKGVIKSAHDDLNCAKSIMMDQYCLEIFYIIERIEELAERADKSGANTVTIGLCAIVYYLAAVGINIARIINQLNLCLDQKPKRTARTKGFSKAYKPIFGELIKYQKIMTDFTRAVDNDCYNAMGHVASQIMVLLEHPSLMSDLELHRRLSHQLELVEGLSEKMYDVHARLESHPLIKIDPVQIPSGTVDLCGAKQMSQPIKLNTSMQEGYHPQPNDKGQPVPIKKPSKATATDTWLNPGSVATATPHDHKNLPAELNGVSFVPWRDAPTTLREWADVDGQELWGEPDFMPVKGKKVGAGVVIREDDGRVWVIHPTNAFGGYQATFPKGVHEDCLPMQASAIKEAFEESGLKVEITGFIGDFERTTSVARYYSARRVGGSPSGMGWESQAVSLVPVGMLSAIANHGSDAPLIDAIIMGVILNTLV